MVSYTMSIEEIEKIKNKDISNESLFWKFIHSENPENAKWKIYNCRFENYADALFISAYLFNLKEALELAKKEFYTKN